MKRLLYFINKKDYGAKLYKPYKTIPWNYNSYKATDIIQDPKVFGIAESFDGTQETDEWHMTSNICGLKDSPLENIVLKDIYFKL